MFFKLFIIGIIGLLSVNADVPVPPYIKVCARTDPKFNECARRSGQAAVPFIAKGDRKHFIPTMDPLNLPHIETSAGDEKSPTSIKFIVDNLLGFGFKDSTVEEVMQDFEKKSIYWRINTPKYFSYGKYNITGRILVVPIRGSGDFNGTLNNLTLHLNGTYDLTQKENGKTYMKIIDTKLTYDITGFHIYLGNLFEGNKELGDAVNDFLNENWKDTSEAVGPILAEAINMVFRNYLETITENISYDDAFPETLP